MNKHRQNYWEANADFRDRPRPTFVYKLINWLCVVAIIGLIGVLAWGPK